MSANASVVCRPTCLKCVGRHVGSVSADVSVVCWPTCRSCVGGVSTDALADVWADALVGSDS